MLSKQALKIALPLFLLAMTFLPTEDAIANTCRVNVDTSAIDDAVQRYCDSQANIEKPDFTAKQGEPGWIPYFFTNPDECDLGVSFPDLMPDINIDISKLNSCEILRAVSKNAVEKVNDKFGEIESGVRNATGGDVNVNVDINDEIDKRVNKN